MHYLVTGGAGFIGSHLCEALLAGGDHVTAVDNFDPSYPRRLKEANLIECQKHPTFSLFEADILDFAALQRVAARYDAIVHLAAKTGVRESIMDPESYTKVNVGGTRNVLELGLEWGVDRFVFASSSSVYGINPHTPWNEEDQALLPISPYGRSKVNGERLGRLYAHLYGVRFTALRFFTVYGPRQRPDLAIRKFTEGILAGNPITVFGDGSASRDYTFIGDLIGGLRASLHHRGSAFEIINLGGSRPTTLLDTIRLIEHATGRKARVIFKPEQPGDVPKTAADSRKAEKLLGYSPSTVLEEGISTFVAWIANANQEGERMSGREGQRAVGAMGR